MTVLFTNCAGSHPDTIIDPNASSAEVESNMEVVTEFSGKLSASFQYVSTDGKAWGYALDSQNKTKALKVIFYAGGPIGTGTYAGEIVAKESGVGPNAGHYFNFKVPPELANGQYQKLWAYGHEAKPEYLIKPSPVTFVSYNQKAEDYYNQNIAPFVNSQCVRCHTWTYQSLMYGPLLNPLPVSTGTATSNRFMRKMNGQDNHNGGAFCNSANDGACALIQNWWRAEFQ
ncbi:MAG: hypothetical protein JNL11_00080 [Bdellovibrionaceae bacterium]|nr:hypothetical protein [Pseudobdellovibrionaceae bacterium]